MARHKCIAFTKLQHYSVNQYTNGVYLSLFNYLIVKCRHTNKTSGKDITGLHGASLKFYVLNMANSNSLFTHCLRKGKKKGVTNFVTP